MTELPFQACEFIIALTVVLALSGLAVENTDIVSVDVNPLVVVDGRPVAVDALVEVRA